ncbi:MAG: thiol:disulfide interchange protein, partial [Bradyrhizobiaceae bacterium]
MIVVAAGVAALALWMWVPVLANAQVDGAEPHTRIALVSDVRTLQPGIPFTAGIVLTMDPGWHTYWKNPGESGLATEVRWIVPEGFTVGETEWPLPEKKIEEGDVLTFGYGGETMLLATITPPATALPGTAADLRVEAEWLECEKTCVPGSGRAALRLPVTGTRPMPANQQLF